MENNFKDEILKDIGEVTISSTQKIRVLVVRGDALGKTSVSIQKWWRPSTKDNWSAGKGFKLSMSETRQLSQLLQGIADNDN